MDLQELLFVKQLCLLEGRSKQLGLLGHFPSHLRGMNVWHLVNSRPSQLTAKTGQCGEVVLLHLSWDTGCSVTDYKRDSLWNNSDWMLDGCFGKSSVRACTPEEVAVAGKILCVWSKTSTRIWTSLYTFSAQKPPFMLYPIWLASSETARLWLALDINSNPNCRIESSDR